MSLELSEFYYDLPKELIAQSPIERRDTSRLLCVDKNTGELHHGTFGDIINYLNPGDCLVLNETKVIPARLLGHKSTGAKAELLLLRRITDKKWETLVKPGNKIKPNDRLIFSHKLSCAILEILDGGNRLVEFDYDGVFEEVLEELGEMPLPPYITERLSDKSRYQTVYAENSGSAAAPTAGLHFTDSLLKDIEEKGVEIARLTLHVGLGTFRPVKCGNILEHKMHSEYFELPEEAAVKINKAKQNGKKVVCVGTTSVRTVESCALNGQVVAKSGETDIFIYPGYKFQIVDNLITNFHLPESTLIMLVSALAGKENILNAYNEAVLEKYRFFSFGDAMFIHDGI